MMKQVPTQSAMEETTLPEVDVIWNQTGVCSWDCQNCCVDAAHVAKRDGRIVIRSRGLTRVEQIPHQAGNGTIYDQALALRQRQGLELDFPGKLRCLDHLDGFWPKIDISGGDPLAVTETIDVMRVIAQRFGRTRVTLTATGAGLGKYEPDAIALHIGELNFTYDNVTRVGNAHRPGGYAPGNLRHAARFARAGVRTRAECPLSVHNLDTETLRCLYQDLHDAGIERLLLMRLFPSGRGALVASDIPTPDQYRGAIELLREMEAALGHPKLKLQCALKFFERRDLLENPCDLMRESFGLMADGTLLASPWAINEIGRPLNDVWVLGNLATTPLRDILASAKAQEYRSRLDHNFGHCKIFSFLHSTRPNPMDRIFDRSDPLYTTPSQHAEQTTDSHIADIGGHRDGHDQLADR